MNTTSWIILIVSIIASLVCITQAETAKVGSLQWWEKQYQIIKQKRNEYLTKLYRGNDYNFAIYAPEEGILVIGQNSKLKQVQFWTHVIRNAIKYDERIKTAQRLSEYRQVDPELRRLYFELNVNQIMIRLLKSQKDQKTYEEYLQQNKNYILLRIGWYKIDEDPKEHIFLKEVAEKVKEEYLKVRQERQRQAELIHLLAEMKDLKALLIQKIDAYKQHLKDNDFSINDL